MMGGDGGAVGFLFLQAVLAAVAWFCVSLWEAGWLTYMQHQHGDEYEYQLDPFETRAWMFTLVVGFNVVVYLFLR